MRVWDIHPGYLNRQSLLGEHRELHGIVSIFVNGKEGYSKHPETLRWVGFGWALRQRHQLLAAEMALRGYNDRSPVLLRKNREKWPETYIDSPWEQILLLKEKYKDREPGRIPLPNNAQQLWSHHKYSVMARDVKIYKKIGREVAETGVDLSELTTSLTEILRNSPTKGGVINALQHMWGYVSDYSPNIKSEVESWSAKRLLKEIQNRTITNKESYLTASTALSELKLWV